MKKILFYIFLASIFQGCFLNDSTKEKLLNSNEFSIISEVKDKKLIIYDGKKEYELENGAFDYKVFPSASFNKIAVERVFLKGKDVVFYEKNENGFYIKIENITSDKIWQEAKKNGLIKEDSFSKIKSISFKRWESEDIVILNLSYNDAQTLEDIKKEVSLYLN